MIARRVLLALWLGAVGFAPSAWASPGEPRIAVASQDDGTISEIDPSSDRVVTRISIGQGPANMAASADGRELFTSHPEHAMIGVVDVAGARVARTLAYKGEPFGIAAGEGNVYLADWSKNLVVRLDGKTGDVTGTIPVGKSPACLAIDTAHHRLYVADRESNDVSVIDTQAMKVLATVPAGDRPFALGLSPDGGRLYVANVRSNDLAVIDTKGLALVARAPAGDLPYGVAVTPDAALILVTNQHGNTLSFLDAKTLKIVAAVPVGRYPEGVVVAGGRAYVANWFSADVSVIDLAQRREVTRIKVGEGPRYLAALGRFEEGRSR